MERDWQETLRQATAVLRSSGNEAVVYFTRRDLMDEAVGPVEALWDLPQPRTILRQQRADGSWRGVPAKTPVYPDGHSRLVATFKAFRTLVEAYEFRRESVPIEKAAGGLFGFQTGDGDIRGFIGNQYATYYTGYVLALLIKAGYARDGRVETGMRWLLGMRQNDGGWTVPVLTHHLDGRTMYRLTSSNAAPVEADRAQPFSHNWTDMVLRAFAAHPAYRSSEEARAAGGLLKSQFFLPDAYSSYQAARYWTRFAFWWPNLLTALESLSCLGFAAGDPDIAKGLRWFLDNRSGDGLWRLSHDGTDRPETRRDAANRLWLGLRICRMLRRFFDR